MRRLVPSVLLLSVLALVLAACGGSRSDTATRATTTTAASKSACRKVVAPSPKGSQKLAKPKLVLDPAKRWSATVETNCGSFTIALDVKQAPRTSASFVYLTRKGFYDGLTFHRIAPGFVIQGGDPLGTGTGGPGYTVVEAPPKNVQYTHGVVAMAKTATEPDGASGSQFYVVIGQDAQLPPQYALLGKVTKGLGVVDRIGALPLQTNDPQGAAPVDPVVIQRVTVAETS
ncbi:MAG: peptidyl-prolyl cis-trans isomerase cyclophilin type [Conexibacter sp.]|nr:peptidyl-prolyl cis-trans isomerase cyclophilin type [Conexibacter sp.]